MSKNRAINIAGLNLTADQREQLSQYSDAILWKAQQQLAKKKDLAHPFAYLKTICDGEAAKLQQGHAFRKNTQVPYKDKRDDSNWHPLPEEDNPWGDNDNKNTQTGWTKPSFAVPEPSHYRKPYNMVKEETWVYTQLSHYIGRFMLERKRDFIHAALATDNIKTETINARIDKSMFEPLRESIGIATDRWISTRKSSDHTPDELDAFLDGFKPKRPS